jgi:hypothetical protein
MKVVRTELPDVNPQRLPGPGFVVDTLNIGSVKWTRRAATLPMERQNRPPRPHDLRRRPSTAARKDLEAAAASEIMEPCGIPIRPHRSEEAAMKTVEVFGMDDTADEDAAVQSLKEAKGLDDHEARQPFGLLYWHKRPFAVRFASTEEADRFLERLGASGYHGRLIAGDDRPDR